MGELDFFFPQILVFFRELAVSDLLAFEVLDLRSVVFEVSDEQVQLSFCLGWFEILDALLGFFSFCFELFYLCSDVFDHLLSLPKCLERRAGIIFIVDKVLEVVVSVFLVVLTALFDEFVHFVDLFFHLGELCLQLDVFLVRIVVFLLHRVVVDVELFLGSPGFLL